MNRNDVETFIRKKYKVEADYPFSKEYAKTAVFRHKDTGKWFALCMKVREDKLGYESDCEWIDVVTMKSEPMLIDGIVLKDGFHRAYHMNKRTWLTVELRDDTNDEEVRNLLELSFELTDKKRKAGSVSPK